MLFNKVDGIKWHQVPQWESVKVISPDDFKILVSNYFLHHRVSCLIKCNCHCNDLSHLYPPFIFVSRNSKCNYSSLPLMKYHDIPLPRFRGSSSSWLTSLASLPVRPSTAFSQSCLGLQAQLHTGGPLDRSKLMAISIWCWISWQVLPMTSPHQMTLRQAV